MSRLAGRVVFVIAAIAAMTAAKLTDYGYAPPVLIVVLCVLVGLVALVRVSWRAHDRWAADYLSWLNTAEVGKWTAWHRENVQYLARRASAR